MEINGSFPPQPPKRDKHRPTIAFSPSKPPNAGCESRRAPPVWSARPAGRGGRRRRGPEAHRLPGERGSCREEAPGGVGWGAGWWGGGGVGRVGWGVVWCVCVTKPPHRSWENVPARFFFSVIHSSVHWLARLGAMSRYNLYLHLLLTGSFSQCVWGGWGRWGGWGGWQGLV